MIKITTNEKWLEFEGIKEPIKSDNDHIFLNMRLQNFNEVEIGFRFGKFDENENFDFYSPEYVFTVEKTSLEIEEASYQSIHTDALNILNNICESEATFAIV
jgi:hypothetical protein